ncbi:MAG: hypothetical protein H6819_05775 [Phycisphaerales bacterium]|nr:hypothetical protein [Phycisphaerales bacterium]
MSQGNADAVEPQVDEADETTVENGAHDFSPCGAPEPDASEKEAVATAMSRYQPLLSGEVAASSVEIHIPVIWHVLHDGSNGDLSDGQIQSQIAALNDAFAGVPGGATTAFRFDLAGITRTSNGSWFAMSMDSSAEFEAKSSLHSGDSETLNIYSVLPPGNNGGWARWPWDYEGAPAMDGVVVHYQSVTGGSLAGYEEGDIAVHEVGHWLGLFHTFGIGMGYGCVFGDEVDDTPPEAAATFGCPDGQDSCPTEDGIDPVHNYMDYTQDACKFEFSDGQSRRMFAMFDHYRRIYPPPSTPNYEGVTVRAHYVSLQPTNVSQNTESIELLWGINGSGQSQTAMYTWPVSGNIRIDNLNPDNDYNVFIRAHNDYGDSEWWWTGVPFHTTGAPAQPNYVGVAARAHYVSLQPTNVSQNTESIELLWGINGSGQSQTATYTWPVSGNIRIDNLIPDNDYNVFIRAHNDYGDSEWWWTGVPFHTNP